MAEDRISVIDGIYNFASLVPMPILVSVHLYYKLLYISIVLVLKCRVKFVVYTLLFFVSPYLAYSERQTGIPHQYTL